LKEAVENDQGEGQRRFAEILRENSPCREKYFSPPAVAVGREKRVRERTRDKGEIYR
jgi:hypothetical protein